MAAGNWLRASTVRYVAKVTIAALAAFALTLGGRNEFALFSAMGAAMVVGSSLGEDLSSSLNRVRGTLAGTAVGLGCAMALGSSLWSIGVASAGLAWLCTGLGWGAAAMRIGLAMALVILFTHGGDPAHYALWRVANTLVGVLIGLAVGRLLWPIRGRDRIGTAIDRLRTGIAASLEALASDAKPEALLARQVDVLDAMADIRAARKEARVEDRVHGHADLLARETMLAARAGIATLDAGLRLGDLAPSAGPPLAAVREVAAALAARARAASDGSDAAAAAEAELGAAQARAQQSLADGGLPAEARAGLGIVLNDLQQLHVALAGLREARSERQG